MRQTVVRRLWEAIHQQVWKRLPGFFHPEAEILWPNTRERFTVSGYTAANSTYPGDWAVDVLEVCEMGDRVLSVARIHSGQDSFHAVSIFSFSGDKISGLVEYFSEDGEAPEWRRLAHISAPMV